MGELVLLPLPCTYWEIEQTFHQRKQCENPVWICRQNARGQYIMLCQYHLHEVEKVSDHSVYDPLKNHGVKQCSRE